MVFQRPKQSFEARVKARVSGVSRGTDLSLLGLALFCVFGVIGCFWASLWVSSAKFGAWIFLAAFLFLLVAWAKGLSDRNALDVPPAQLSVTSGPDSFNLSLPLDKRDYVFKKMFSCMRTVVQARAILPAPRGAVVGNPSDAKVLREYSPEERAVVEKRWNEEIPKHDEQVIEGLVSRNKILEARTGGEQANAPHGATGIVQSASP